MPTCINEYKKQNASNSGSYTGLYHWKHYITVLWENLGEKKKLPRMRVLVLVWKHCWVLKTHEGNTNRNFCARYHSACVLFSHIVYVAYSTLNPHTASTQSGKVEGKSIPWMPRLNLAMNSEVLEIAANTLYPRDLFYCFVKQSNKMLFYSVSFA